MYTFSSIYWGWIVYFHLDSSFYIIKKRSDDYSISKWIYLHWFPSFIIYLRVCNQRNTAGHTSKAETICYSGSLEFTPGFLWGTYCSICVVFCKSFLVHLFFYGHCIVCPSSVYGFWLLSVSSKFSDRGSDIF
jgi:hypothetical protein